MRLQLKSPGLKENEESVVVVSGVQIYTEMFEAVGHKTQTSRQGRHGQEMNVIQCMHLLESNQHLTEDY